MNPTATQRVILVSPEEPSLAELSWRLRALETTVGKVEGQINEGLASIHHRFDGLSFVRTDVYMSDQRALAEKVDNAHRLAMWAVGLTASTTIGAIVTGILTMSGAFR